LHADKYTFSLPRLVVVVVDVVVVDDVVVVNTPKINFNNFFSQILKYHSMVLRGISNTF